MGFPGGPASRARIVVEMLEVGGDRANSARVGVAIPEVSARRRTKLGASGGRLGGRMDTGGVHRPNR